MKKLIALILSLAFVSAFALAAEKPAVKVPVSASVTAPAAVTPAAKTAKVYKKSKKISAVKAGTAVSVKPAVK